MGGYRPLYIKGNTKGLVQNRQNFLLPDDAYPTLQNAYIWREQIRRKQGFQLLGRLRRKFTSSSLGNDSAGSTTMIANAFSTLSITEANAEFEVGSVVITVGGTDAAVFTDNSLGGFTVSGKGLAAGSSINYVTGAIVLQFSPAANGGQPITITFNYFPGLPVMGLRTEELNAINSERLIAFDTTYAYEYNSGWQEFITGTTWTGTDANFFWSTNYWVNAVNVKLFWVTNFSGQTGDYIKYTDGTTWKIFGPTGTPVTGLLDASGNYLNQCLAMVPFRGRLVAFNTLEGALLSNSVNYFQRIRWSTIGNPLLSDSWRDDIRGKGGFLDIPTSENITAIGFVRDNLVIYCESSTWQLRYTGRSIAPFQVEKVNVELGAASLFSAVQFDTSLAGIGDKGIVECDSYKSERIDINIPDLVFDIQSANNGPQRVHGARDFLRKLVYWIYPSSQTSTKFPDTRLVYNYENLSWAIFQDSLTCFGTYQPQEPNQWQDYVEVVPANTWAVQDYNWAANPAAILDIVAGNQQGFVEILDQRVINDISLSITNITGNVTTPTVITSPNHNLQTNQVVSVSNIPTGTPFATNLNGNVFNVVVVDANNFQLWIYDPDEDAFSEPELDPNLVYVGGGKISIRDNFNIVSKKFNAIDDGQKIQLGYIDILMNDTYNGAITLNVYLDYDDVLPINTLPQNESGDTGSPDTFFNSVIPTSSPTLGLQGPSKNWQRVFCNVRGNFFSIVYTLSNAQMIGIECESDVQIDSQVIWGRSAGRIGF